ncbi:MAG: class I SAM-dependent methyltransferase [Actinobacteria bacterium]|nr:class I SAM-dependent methyltransferase [Actinomycetota bacterium]MCL5883605.1 class I SAM-dependent methyltransferase [Actinomycetota bacterium]
MNDVLSLYAHAPRMTRAFLRGRVFLSDLEFVESFVPKGGTVVDLGCGYGLFSNLLAVRGPGRQVRGIDIDCARIDEARRTIGSRGNIEFICSGLEQLDESGCAAITIADVLYLLPHADQVRLLGECFRRLADGGVLVWKAQDRRPRWKYAFTYIQELIATSSGLTKGRRSRLTFMSREEAAAAMQKSGFEVRIVEMRSWRPYTDVLYLGRKNPPQVFPERRSPGKIQTETV